MTDNSPAPFSSLKAQVDLYTFDATLLSEWEMDQMAWRIRELCSNALKETPQIAGDEGCIYYFNHDRKASIAAGYPTEFGAWAGPEKYVIITPTLIGMLTPEQRQAVGEIYLEYKKKIDAKSKPSDPVESHSRFKDTVKKILGAGKSRFHRDPDGPGMAI